MESLDVPKQLVKGRIEQLAKMEKDPADCGLFVTLWREAVRNPDMDMDGDYVQATIRLLAAIHAPVCPRGKGAHGADT